MVLNGMLVPLRPGLGLLLLALAAGACAGPSEPTPPALVRVGERTETGKVALTVNSVNRVNQIGESSTPPPGSVFLLADITIQNGSDHNLDYGRYQFTVADTQGRVYEPATVPGLDKPLLTARMQSQKDATGMIVFRVAADSGSLTLKYQVPGERHPLVVDLGRPGA